MISDDFIELSFLKKFVTAEIQSRNSSSLDDYLNQWTSVCLIRKISCFQKTCYLVGETEISRY